MIALFALPLVFLAYGLYSTRLGWRVTLIRAAIVWSCLAIAAAESLSVVGAVNRTAITLAWLLATIGSLLLALRRRKYTQPPHLPRFTITPTIVAISAIAIVTGILALFCAPVAVDALTYHLPRVSHWIQNGSLEHYPTHHARQLWISPGAEYYLLHIQLLTRSDRLVNLVQWSAFIGCAMNASLIARHLGAGGAGQRYAALFAASLPIAALQASGAQVDLVFAFWLSAGVALLLDVLRDWQSETFWKDIPFVGAAVALAVLTKGTAYVFALPFVMWTLISGVRHNAFRLAGMVGVIIMLIAMVNAPHSIRNLETYGHPLGPPQRATVLNAELSARATMSNLLRQIGLNFGTHYSPLDTTVFRAVTAAHDAMGMNVNDPRITYRRTKYGPIMMAYDEQAAANPIHLVLIVASSIAIVVMWRRQSRMAVWLVTAVFAALIAYCAYLRWQPWGTRFLMPLFILAAPAVGLTFEKLSRRWIVAVACMAMLAHVAVALSFNPLRPLAKNPSLLAMPRTKQYFVATPWRHEQFEEIVARIHARQCRKVGIVLGNNDLEHPLWVMLQRDSRGRSEIRHIDAPNSVALSGPRDKAFTPCAIYSDSSSARPAWPVREGYLEEWRAGPMRLYFPG